MVARRKLVELLLEVSIFLMSRRAQRRKSPRKSSAKAKGGGGWIYRILGILVVMAILTGFGGYFWLKSYLHSDDFRVFLGEKVGAAIGADAQFELFEWQGMKAQTEGFSADNGKLIKSMRADGVEAKINLSGVKRGVWEVSGLRVKQLDVMMDTRGEKSVADSQTDEQKSIGSTGNGGFLTGFLPKRAELTSAQIDWLNVDFKSEAGQLKATNVITRIDAAAADGAYAVNLADGLIETTWFNSPLDLVSARGKYQAGRIFITESKAKVYERGVLNLSGEVEGGEFGFFGSLRDVRMEELVPVNWQKRITGDLSTQFKISSGSVRPDGTQRDTTLKGELELKRGVLTSLPILDTIAAYANTRRFRRLDFSEAKLKYKKVGSRLELTDIVLATEGLVRVEGRLTLEDGGVIDGHFKVGITPGTLAHIPGAESKVFLRGDKGLLWSPLRITGTVDSPKEDLTDRMIAAAGERMFELIPETGQMVLKFAKNSAVQLPSAAVGTGADALRTGADAVKKGLEEGVIEGVEEGVRGVFDLIPSNPILPREQPKKDPQEKSSPEDTSE